MHHSGRLLLATIVIVAPGACRTAPRPAPDGPAAAAPTAPTAPPPSTGTSAGHAAGHGAGHAVAPASGADTARRGWTAADVRFVQHMLPHHAQALVMAALVPARTTRTDLRMLAERITVSQQDEIAQMRRWLEKRGEAVPATDGPHAAHGDMPGMLTPAELSRLGAASGAAFDRLFLEYMVRHHEGALTMVAELLGAAGAARDPELYQIASDVDADQRAEIRRMRALLDALPAAPAR